MKKLFSFGLVMIVLATLMWVNVQTASAIGLAPPPTPPPARNPAPSAVVYSSDFEGLEPGQKVQAQMFVESNLMNIYCVVTQTDGYVKCRLPRKYAGQSVVLYVTAGGKTLVFYVTLPEQSEEEPAPVPEPAA